MAPKTAKREFELGNKDVDSLKFADAIAHFRKAIAIYPAFVMARNNLGAQLQPTSSDSILSGVHITCSVRIEVGICEAGRGTQDVRAWNTPELTVHHIEGGDLKTRAYPFRNLETFEDGKVDVVNRVTAQRIAADSEERSSQDRGRGVIVQNPTHGVGSRSGTSRHIREGGGIRLGIEGVLTDRIQRRRRIRQYRTACISGRAERIGWIAQG